MQDVMIRVRMSSHDAHYAGDLIDGARLLGIFGDIATELLIRNDGDEGLFVAYDNVEFLSPVYDGDYIEAYGQINKIGNTSRKMSFIAKKVIASVKDVEYPSAADVLEQAIIVGKASGTCLVKKERQRR